MDFLQLNGRHYEVCIILYCIVYCVHYLATEWWVAGMVICVEPGADLHMAQLLPLPLTVSCFSKIQVGFTFLELDHLGSPGKRAVKRVCVYVCI